MTKLKIKVTKDILERSKNCGLGDDNGFKGHSCAIALAVRDLFPFASIGFNHIKFDDRTQKTIGNISYLDLETRMYIQYFDVTSPDVRPKLPEYEFQIEVPNEVIEKINIEELKPLLQNHPTLQLIEN